MRLRDRRSTVVEQLECPRCAIRIDHFDPEAFRGIQVCFKRRCEQHWWAMRLLRGEVRPQLAEVFTEGLAVELMRMWQLPAVAPTPVFWQLSLSRNQSDQLKQAGSRSYFKLVTTLDRLGHALVSTLQ